MEFSEPILRSVNSASNLSRRQHCPGSALAEKDLPRVDSEESREGTLLHWADANPGEGQAKLDAKQREVVQRNAGLRAKFIAATLERLGIPQDAECKVLTEREFVLCAEDGEPVTSHGQPVVGHPDYVYWYPQYLTVIITDSKFGRIPVEKAWTNLQLRFYAVAVGDQFGADTTVVAITQPWAPSPNDLHSAEYGAKNLPDFRRELMDILAATERADAPRHPSIEACRYCLACSNCPVAVHAAMELAEVRVQEVTVEQLEALGPSVELAKKVCDAWYKRMLCIAKDFPEQLHKYELGEVKERRKIENLVMAKRLLEDAQIIPAGEDGWHKFCEWCSISLGDIEASHMLATQCTSKSAELTIEKILGPLITKKPMERSLVKKQVNYHTPHAK